MTLSDLGAIGELIGGFAVILTLFYLAIQVKKNQQATLAETFAASQELALETERFFIDIAPAWAKLKNGEELTEAEDFQIERAIEARHNAAFFSYARNKALAQGSHDIIVERFASFLIDNPHIRDRWERFRTKMGDRREAVGIPLSTRSTGMEFTSKLDQYLKILDEGI
jgi:hypothetical protein